MTAAGEEYIVDITGVSHQGMGVGRINDLVVFVPKALMGEQVLVGIDEVKKNLANGTLLKILRNSPHRVNPPCRESEHCGGCELQHADYPYQLQAKGQIVSDAMLKLARTNLVPEPVEAMANPWHYRNKGVFHVDYRPGQVVVGFYQQGSHQCTSARNCLLFSQRINALTAYLEEALLQYSKVHYVQKIMIRQSRANQELMLVFVTKDNVWRLTDMLKKLTEDFPDVVSIYHNINTNPKVMLGKSFQHLYGKTCLIDTIGALQFQISPESFFQVNNEQAEKLYQYALTFAQLKGSETIVDAYCGIGTISLYLAQQAKFVYGIEAISQAVKDAQQNARLNGIDNCKFIIAKVEEWLPKWQNKGNHADVIVVDPPRKGCDSQMLHALANSQSDKIIYISCNPSTLARDIRYLCDNGYRLERIQPVDLFAVTWHVEIVCLLSKAVTK